MLFGISIIIGACNMEIPPIDSVEEPELKEFDFNFSNSIKISSIDGNSWVNLRIESDIEDFVTIPSDNALWELKLIYDDSEILPDFSLRKKSLDFNISIDDKPNRYFVVDDYFIEPDAKGFTLSLISETTDNSNNRIDNSVFGDDFYPNFRRDYFDGPTLYEYGQVRRYYNYNAVPSLNTRMVMARWLYRECRLCGMRDLTPSWDYLTDIGQISWATKRNIRRLRVIVQHHGPTPNNYDNPTNTNFSVYFRRY
ncbi:hypothetical protein A33Q_0263 [Indibacter alkaliphilus LW1]|uniref:Uncharacterized protein n=1 Tax=Indibacter alkaliphilus (strain CCUG 57479 / KCTC 22604 / LW1) TaxID=1189612 RepID=S2DLX9_INDAL|nr:hypothetical protein [Indibacter alkaliphilus]EPA00095.1 hypothetical protein A33Q_0263 [Indibacter alkaliphilus LW1]